MQSGLFSPPVPEIRLDPRQVSGGFEEFKESLAGNRRRAGIRQGVKVEYGVLHHRGVEHDSHAAGGIVDRGKRGYRAGFDAEEFAHQLGGAEREPPGCPKNPVQRLKFNRRIFTRHHQVGRTLFVAQEQVLGMAPGNRAAQIARLLDREHRRMSDGLVGDAEPIQIGKKLIGRGRHVRYLGRRSCGCKAVSSLA